MIKAVFPRFPNQHLKADGATIRVGATKAPADGAPQSKQSNTPTGLQRVGHRIMQSVADMLHQACVPRLVAAPPWIRLLAERRARQPGPLFSQHLKRSCGNSYNM